MSKYYFSASMLLIFTFSVNNKPNTPLKVEQVKKSPKQEPISATSSPPNKLSVPSLTIKTNTQSGAAKVTSQPATKQEGGATTATAPSDGDDVDSLDRTEMPMIRGGLNGSIADILEASGYGTETDFKIDENLG